MPKAYVVAEIQVHNPEGYADYRALSTESIAQYGGTWLVRGGNRVQFEGSDERHDENWRTVVVEFPSMEQARTWYESPEYTRASAIRKAHSIGRLFIVEGV